MIINDLQYIETATETEVQGAGHSRTSSYARSGGDASSYGDYSRSDAYFYAVADSDFRTALAGGYVEAESSNKGYHYNYGY